jgi:hypothetical protein
MYGSRLEADTETHVLHVKVELWWKDVRVAPFDVPSRLGPNGMT